MVDSIIWVFGSPILISAASKQLSLAAFIGFLIGLERAYRGKAASTRTFSVISTGSCLYTILSVQAAGGPNALPHDISRIAAQIVSGVGFLGGGVIFKSVDRIEGITTGALVWLTAAIGMACGFNQIELVVWSMLIGVGIHVLSSLSYHYFAWRRLGRMRQLQAHPPQS